jgi:hypothetical protein
MIILRLIIHDRIANKKYKTPNHSEVKAKDDFHRKVKPEIIKGISRKIKEVLGKNGDIAIEDGEIIYVSQKFDPETGKKKRMSKKTGLDASVYFDFSVLTILSIHNVMVEYDFDYSLNVIQSIKKEVRIELEFNVNDSFDDGDNN